MLLVVLTSLLFLPLLLSGQAFGRAVSGYATPLGVALLVGSFAFGLGMQTADACASGTLYHTGGGDVRGLLTLGGFLAGSLLGTYRWDRWMAAPHLPAVLLLHSLGPAGAVAVQLVLAGGVAALTLVLERRRYGEAVRILVLPGSGKMAGRAGWSLAAGAAGLAVANFLTLLVAGRPWGITSAFALLAAKAFGALGGSPGAWAYWRIPANAQALRTSVWADVTTVMDLGAILGALLAAAVAGRFPRPYLRRVRVRTAAGAVLGGVLMGWGARLAFGCNIGAFVSGVASFSLHGWVWFAFALLGSRLGVKLRPLFGYAA